MAILVLKYFIFGPCPLLISLHFLNLTSSLKKLRDMLSSAPEYIRRQHNWIQLPQVVHSVNVHICMSTGLKAAWVHDNNQGRIHMGARVQ